MQKILSSAFRSLLLLCCLGGTGVVRAQEAGLAREVAAAHKNGQAFRTVSLFSALNAAPHASLLRNETALRLNADAVQALFIAKSPAISLSLTDKSGHEFLLELIQSKPMAAAPELGVIDAAGRHRVEHNTGLHYQGIVNGATGRSMATLSVFEDGEVMGLFSTYEGNYNLGKLGDGSGDYILYNDFDLLQHPSMAPCGVTDATMHPGGSEENTANKVLRCNKLGMYWEVSYNVYTSKASNLTSTVNYITGLFNQIAALYSNDEIPLELRSLYIWTVQDDYPTTSSTVALNKFRAYWNLMDNGFNGDLAHLITRDNNGNGGGNGGLAYLDVMCSRNYAYGYSDIYGNFQNIPAFSWDVEVISHEVGHNMGSNHTHWCGWNTGANNSCGAIDNCNTLETTPGCSTCGSTYLNSASTSAWKGSIMSYCHLVSRGINLANGFGPLPGARVRNNISTSTCLRPALNATLASSPICNGDGSVSVSFAANNIGTAPYSYLWTGGVITQNLTNIANPGTYSVTITDSNNCSASFATTVAGYRRSGDASTSVVMPVCCENTGQTFRLNATAPANLGSCETLYWLRSSQPLISMTQVQDYFDTTNAANRLPSSNPTAISQGAALDAMPPQECSGLTTYYYLPVAVAEARNADSIVSNVSGGANITVGAANIGKLVDVPDQTALLPGCAADSVVRSLRVTVTGYTGRPNKMRLIVLDAGDSLMYAAYSLPGNGTYTVPASAIKGGTFLQGMQVGVLDYNCSDNTTCVSSTSIVSVTRKAVYPALPLRLAKACFPGNAARVDFAPTGCTRLSVHTVGSATAGRLSVFPNPASSTVTVRVSGNAQGQAVRIMDVSGRLVHTVFLKGSGEQSIDVHSWAKGVYQVQLSGDTGGVVKLVME